MIDPAPPRFWNVPNSLTMARLGLSVGVFALIARGSYSWALATFGVAAITDALDGYFARKLGQSTALGRQLDPLVDKVFVAGAYIFLLAVPGTGLAPWMVATVVARELLIQGLRSHLEGSGTAFGAGLAGKLKTTFQCLSIVAILAVLAIRPGASAWLVARDATTWIAIILTIYSGLGYVARAIPSLRGGAVP